MTSDLQSFQAQRPRLFAIAYRMLGSASDAEDVLQDAWVRFQSADAAGLRSVEAFAATIVTRLCLDRLKSARAKRETYVGPWLPEPVLTTREASPDVLTERSESVTLAFLVLLEMLSAEERAVFLLKEVFDYEHAEVAEMLGTTAANSRQLFHRAKAKLRPAPAESGIGPVQARQTQRRPDGSDDREARRELADRFARAFRSADASELTSLLAADVTFVADGGGKAVAARRPLSGRDDVVRFLVGIHRTAQATGVRARSTVTVMEVNSEPALVIRVGAELDGVFVLTIRGGAVAGIRVVRNPEKLKYLDRQITAIM